LVNEAAEEMICKLFPGDQRWAGTSPEYHRKGFIKGAFHARSIYEARLAEEAKVRAQLVEALEDAKQRIVFDNEDDFDCGIPSIGADYQPEAFEAVGLVESINAALAAAKEIK
jgi:hypothetical protein